MKEGAALKIQELFERNRATAVEGKEVAGKADGEAQLRVVDEAPVRRAFLRPALYERRDRTNRGRF
jgi:hypothetical protein